MDNKTILIVDDESDMLLILKFRLKKYYNVETAVDGKDGINKAKSILPDLILLDVNMPEYTGYEVSRILKSNETTKNIIIVLCTASDVDGVEERLSDSLADDYIIKPVKPNELLEKIKKYI